MFIDELKTYITANTSLVFGTTLFMGYIPDGVNKCVVMQQGNMDNVYQLGNTLGHFVINIVFRVRGDQTENTTRALAQTVETVLENLTTDFANYKLVRGVFETPMYQLDGTDQNNNYIYAGIYSCIVERK